MSKSGGGCLLEYGRLLEILTVYFIFWLKFANEEQMYPVGFSLIPQGKFGRVSLISVVEQS